MSGARVHFTPDMELWPEVQDLIFGHCVGKSLPALGMVHRLWVALFQETQAGQRPGVLSAKAVMRWEAAAARDAEYPKIAVLVACGLIAPATDGPAGTSDFLCRRFAALHPELDPAHRDPAEVGRRMSSMQRGLKKAESPATQLTLEMDRTWFQLPDGKPAAADICRQVYPTVVMLDRALGRMGNPRGQHQIGEGLVRGLVALLAEHGYEKLKACGARLVRSYGDPAIPATTEELVQNWEHVVPLLKQ